MRSFVCFAAALAAVCAAGAAQAAGPLSVYANASLGQNFMGGIDYLPDGDVIGMYTDPNMVENSYLGIADANGDGVPAAVNRIYEFGYPTFGIAVRVSPDGSRVLFGESLDPATFQPRYKIYSMNVSGQDFREIAPSGGTFEGAYDIAFIDAGHCYVSANPGSFPATTNKIFHLDLSSGKLVELISVGGTYAGPIDVDADGNLYYARGKANFPVQAGDFSLLRFDAAKLQGVLSGGDVLDETDAVVMASGLDGGQDVAWHSSGTVFVSDANNHAVYQVSPEGAVSDYSSFPGDSGEGFWFLSIYRKDLPLSAGAGGRAELMATYQPLPGAGEPDVRRLSPQVGAGERLLLSAAVSGPVPISFDAYVVLAGASGARYSVTNAGLREGLSAYAAGVPGLPGDFAGKLLDMEVPPGVAGAWTVYAGLMPAGIPPSPAGALALDTVELAVR